MKPSDPGTKRISPGPFFFAHYKRLISLARSRSQFWPLVSSGFAAISDLRVEQTLTAERSDIHGHSCAEDFLSLVAGLACNGEDLAAPRAIRAFKVALPCEADPGAGVEPRNDRRRNADHHVGWSGSERQNGRRGAEYIDTGTCGDEPLDDGLPRTADAETPVNLFQISVEAGSEKVFTNFERAVGSVRPNRMVRPFRMGVVDRDGRSWCLISGARAYGDIRPTGRSSRNIPKIIWSVGALSRTNARPQEPTVAVTSLP